MDRKSTQNPLRRKSKYGNVRLQINGIFFDSKKEYKRYTELKLMERAGLIQDLRLQVPFVLVPEQIGGLRKELPVKYLADFYYYDKEKSKYVIEDCKGVKTKDYIIKRKLMKLAGHEIVEV